jgi:hypothetical protein
MIVKQILDQNMDHHSLRVLEAETIKRSDDFIEPTPIVEEKKKKNSRSKNQIK